MLKYLIVIVLSIVFTSMAEDFNIFENNVAEKQRLYNTLKPHKFRLNSGGFFQGSESFATSSLTYNYFFNKKIASLVEFGSIFEDADIDQLLEVNAGITYRITRRTLDLVFLGDLGLSYNKYLVTNNDHSVNHGFAGLTCEYVWDNGFGVDLSLRGYMPFKFSVDEDIIIKTGVSFVYQFK